MSSARPEVGRKDQLVKRMNVRRATIFKLETGSPNARMEAFFDALITLELEFTAGPRASETNFGDLY